MEYYNQKFLFFVSVALLVAIASHSLPDYAEPWQEIATPTPVDYSPTPTFESQSIQTSAIPITNIDEQIDPTPSAFPAPDYESQFKLGLGTSSDSCMPDQTKDDIGVYIYDLNSDQELVSINADVPFQFASAFKAPVLAYFLSSCQKYWDPTSTEWNEYFLDSDSARNIDWYTSDAYRELAADQISNVHNWDNIETFFVDNTFKGNGGDGIIDKRYFVLNQVYKMVTVSSNAATADVLRFVYDNCLDESQVAIEESCGAPNALTAYNLWFDDFTQTTYQNGEKRRGLYRWDVILEKNLLGKYVETPLSTYGLVDKCVTGAARLNCSSNSKAVNVLTARDFFKFYYALFHNENERLKETALDILKIDLEGSARGNLKNLGRKIQADTMSKNGYAFFKHDSIITDAGIIEYQGSELIVVTLSYNAQTSMNTLYGEYDVDGTAISSAGLIEELLNLNLKTPR